MSRAAVCAVLVACSTPLEVEKLPPPGPRPTADSIVANMLETYGKVTTYGDHGNVVATENGASTSMAFQTSFVRPENVRYELFIDDPRRRLVIWSNGANTLVESALTPGRIDAVEHLQDALVAVARDSTGASMLVPELLLTGRSPLLSSTGTLTGSDTLDGHDCWKIEETMQRGSWTLWIDKRDHLLRRAINRYRDASETISYDPVLISAKVAPIDTAGKTVVDNRNPTWIGVRFDGTTTKITQVIPKGPAERAGLAFDDEIVSVNGDAVTKSNDVITRVRATKPGGRIALRVQRHGAPLDISLAAEVMPDVDKLTHDALIDKPAPDFSLPVVNAVGSATLADLAKDIVVIDFWATWCKPCEIARPHLNEIQAKHTGKLHVVAISNEDLKDITDYLAAHEMKFTVAHDPDGKVWSSYIVGGLPTTIVIAKGRIRYVGVGVDDAALDDAVAKALVQ